MRYDEGVVEVVLHLLGEQPLAFATGTELCRIELQNVQECSRSFGSNGRKIVVQIPGKKSVN